MDDVAEAFPRFSNISGTEIRSWMGVPLIAHGEKLGLLAFDSAEPGFFTPEAEGVVLDEVRQMAAKVGRPLPE